MTGEVIPQEVLAFTLADGIPLSHKEIYSATRSLSEAVAWTKPAAGEGQMPDIWSPVAELMSARVRDRAGRGAVALYVHQRGDDYRNNLVTSHAGGYLIGALAENRCSAQAEEWALEAGGAFYGSQTAAFGIAALGSFGSFDKMLQFLELDPKTRQDLERQGKEGQLQRRIDDVNFSVGQLMASRTAGALTAALIAKDPASRDPLGLRLMREHADRYMQTQHASLGIGALGANLRAYTTMVDFMEPHILELAQHTGVRLPVKIGLSTPLTRDRMLGIITTPAVKRALRKSGAAEDINKKLKSEALGVLL